MFFRTTCVALLATVAAVYANETALRGLAVNAPPVAAAGAPKNHEVCYTIANTWWSTREAEKTRSFVVQMDTDCQAWDQQPELCNANPTTRLGMVVNPGSYSQAQLGAFCSTVGAHDHRCLANPCNHLNTGDCTLQGTQGQCVWWWGQNFTDYNKFRVSQGETPLPVHGCYRNPCNMPGLGTQKDACPLRSAPGLFTCTWCQGAGDPVLNGRGIGCQMTVPTTGAMCAPVNSAGVSKPSVQQAVAQSRCQCSTDYIMCKSIVNSGRTPFKPRYG